MTDGDIESAFEFTNQKRCKQMEEIEQIVLNPSEENIHSVKTRLNTYKTNLKNRRWVNLLSTRKLALRVEQTQKSISYRFADLHMDAKKNNEDIRVK